MQPVATTTTIATIAIIHLDGEYCVGQHQRCTTILTSSSIAILARLQLIQVNKSAEELVALDRPMNSKYIFVKTLNEWNEHSDTTTHQGDSTILCQIMQTMKNRIVYCTNNMSVVASSKHIVYTSMT